MKPRGTGWWLLAIALSMLLHGLLFTAFGKRKLPAAEVEENSAELVSVRLTFLQPESELEPEPEPKSEPKSEPELKPKPEPKPKPKPRSKPKPKAKPKPVASQPPLPSHTAKPIVKPASAAELRQRYLASLLASIEARKTYPGAARRRAIEGKVGVSFRVSCDGSVSELNIANGHKLLKRSAVQALESAQPFPQPPPGLNCPIPVSYAMAFQLR